MVLSVRMGKKSSAQQMEPSIVVVGISLQEEESKELLSWAMSVAACPGDTVVALHVIVENDDRDSLFAKKRIVNAKAILISLLGPFMDLWQAKQMKVEAKVLVHSSLEKALVDETAALGASFLVLGSSTYQVPRDLIYCPSLRVAKYCLEHLPTECSVITVKDRRDVPLQGLFPNVPQGDSPKLPQEGNHWLNLKWHTKDVGKSLGSLHKKFLSKMSFQSREHGELADHMNKENKSSHEQTEKHSPRGVLEVPTLCLDQEESSPSDSSVGSSSPPKNDDDEESVSEVNQQNCLNILNNVNMQRNKCFKLFSSSLGRRSMQIPSTSKYNEESNFYSSPNSEICEDSRANGGISWRPSWRCFTYEEISIATKNFHSDNVIGQGGYAEVYKGVLIDGQAIAVKRLMNGSTDEQKEKEFLTELGIIGHICHPNTASLLGCCIENGLHLIFHFSPNGSLGSHLHGTKTAVLEWSIRYKVAVGTARGLHYLHKCCQRRIIHRDIKASNVLLGTDFEPKISDFGLAKWLPRQWTHHSVSPVEGTYGYLAPEYFMHGIVDEKTDVFAFGVLLLEIVSGRKPFDLSQQNILQWAKPSLDSGNIEELADPRLQGQYDIHEMKRVVFTASLCIRQSAIWRPSMSEVLQLLTDRDIPVRTDCWKMPASKPVEIDDYWDELKILIGTTNTTRQQDNHEISLTDA